MIGERNLTHDFLFAQISDALFSELTRFLLGVIFSLLCYIFI